MSTAKVRVANCIIFNDDELDFIEGGEADDELELLPELVGAVMTPAVDPVSAQGMTPPVMGGKGLHR